MAKLERMRAAKAARKAQGVRFKNAPNVREYTKPNSAEERNAIAKEKEQATKERQVRLQELIARQKQLAAAKSTVKPDSEEEEETPVRGESSVQNINDDESLPSVSSDEEDEFAPPTSKIQSKEKKESSPESEEEEASELSNNISLGAPVIETAPITQTVVKKPKSFVSLGKKK